MQTKNYYLFNLRHFSIALYFRNYIKKLIHYKHNGFQI